MNVFNIVCSWIVICGLSVLYFVATIVIDISAISYGGTFYVMYPIMDPCTIPEMVSTSFTWHFFCFYFDALSSSRGSSYRFPFAPLLFCLAEELLLMQMSRALRSLLPMFEHVLSWTSSVLVTQLLLYNPCQTQQNLKQCSHFIDEEMSKPLSDLFKFTQLIYGPPLRNRFVFGVKSMQLLIFQAAAKAIL